VPITSSAYSLLEQGCERSIEVPFAARMQDMKREPARAGRGLHVSRQSLGVGIGRIDEQRNNGGLGDQLVQQRQTLWCQLRAQVAHAREVAAGPIQAGDKA
jgi:hypothetical protein